MEVAFFRGIITGWTVVVWLRYTAGVIVVKEVTVGSLVGRRVVVG